MRVHKANTVCEKRGGLENGGDSLKGAKEKGMTGSRRASSAGLRTGVEIEKRFHRKKGPFRGLEKGQRVLDEGRGNRRGTVLGD